MKKFDLENTLVSELTPIEAENLKDYLMTCRLRVRVKFILQVMDNEPFLSMYNQREELLKEIKFKKNERKLNNNKNIDSEIEILIDKLRNIPPSRCEIFLADHKFDNIRNLILENENLDELSDNEWFEMENNYIRKRRREKLIQLNNIIS